MADHENRQKLMSQETHSTGGENPLMEQSEKPVADWKAYTSETLHALEV